MRLRERLERKITIKRWELNFVIISTLLFTLFLIQAWPRFRSDAMSINWYWYLVLALIFSVPAYKTIFSQLRKA
jgi:hypothetical protein